MGILCKRVSVTSVRCIQVVAEPTAPDVLIMNDKYFFGLLDRMTAGAFSSVMCS